MLKVQLKRTCYSCPEAYNAYIDDKYVGYVRLRNGYFHATYKWEDDCVVVHDIVYHASFTDDTQGSFKNDEQRRAELNAACHAIIRAHYMNRQEDLYEIVGNEDEY